MKEGNQQRINLVFSNQFDHQDCHVLKVPEGFIKQLQQAGELQIQAQPSQHIILSSSQQTYRMKGVNLSTSFLLIDSSGTIHKESEGYIELETYEPQYHLIYQKLFEKSCVKLPSQYGASFEQMMESYAFTEEDFRSWAQLNQKGFQLMKQKCDFIEIRCEGVIKYLFMPLPLAVQMMRRVIECINQMGLHLFSCIPFHQLAKKQKIFSPNILYYLANFFKAEMDEINNQKLKLTARSICIYVITELAISKDQYSEPQFNDLAKELLALYMPAQVNFQNPEIVEIIKQERFNFFIQKILMGGGVGSGKAYVYYDFMLIDTNVGERLKFLNGFKKRWTQPEIKAIFRGMNTTENGKAVGLEDILLKKFRKYGEEYEIKFILPK